MVDSIIKLLLSLCPEIRFYPICLVTGVAIGYLSGYMADLKIRKIENAREDARKNAYINNLRLEYLKPDRTPNFEDLDKPKGKK